MLRKLIILLTIFPLILCVDSYAKKKSGYKVEKVEVEGLAPITDNLTRSRNNALHDAQKRAVESVVGIYISADSLVSKAKLVEDNITSQTEGFIQDYKILKEKKGKNFYKIKIRAWVRREDISKKISEMSINPDTFGNPSLSFWISEKIDNEESTSNTVETVLMKSFIDSGYSVSENKPGEFYSNESKLLNDSPENLKKLKSDIIVLGDASSNLNTNTGLGGLISYRSNMNIRILMTATNEIITTKSISASGIDVTNENSAKKSFENAASKIKGELPKNVLAFLKEKAYPTVTVYSLKDFYQLERLTRSIKAFPTVKDCWVKSFTDDTAIITLALKRGTLNDVAKMIELSDTWTTKTINVGKYNVEIKIISQKK